MKSFIVAICFVACACAASVDEAATVLRSDYEQTPEGNFQYAFETSQGITAQATGQLKSIGKDELALEVSGSSQFRTPEGELIETIFVANENGYQPQGAHLPTPPAPEAIPDYIQRSLDYIKAHPYTEKS